MLNIKIIEVDIDNIIPYENNPRNNDDSVKKVAESIKQFGFKQPLVLDGNNLIIVGHTRLKASKQLGLKRIPCIIANDMTEEKIKAYRLADNKTAELSEWDMKKLSIELEELNNLNFDMSMLGFEDFELSDDKEIKEDNFDVEKEIENIIEPEASCGNIYILGNHRLMCGDSTKENDVSKLMNSNKSDMVFTDPPYNINYGNIKHEKFKQREIKNDNMTKDEFNKFCNEFCININKFTDGCVFIAGPPGPDGRIMFCNADNIMHCSTTIIWNKDRFTLGRGKYHNKYEPIWFGWTTNGNNFINDRTLTNVWDIARPSKSELHPTMKPLELVSNAIKHASKKNQIVLDLFGGSGSTLIACEQTERKCFMMELDEKYCDVIIKRWELLTSKKAELINGGG